MPEYRGKTLYDVLFRNGQVDKFPLSELAEGQLNDESDTLVTMYTRGYLKNMLNLVAVMVMTWLHLICITKRVVYAGRL